ncbi:MAG: hypothetical protein MUE37_08145 [Bacteroidales bacterium]|nr:hypothetical protein [Bacteroidales bacterium]
MKLRDHHRYPRHDRSSGITAGTPAMTGAQGSPQVPPPWPELRDHRRYPRHDRNSGITAGTPAKT